MPTVLDFNRIRETVLPEWTKPENASVFDPSYRAPVRALIKMLGLDDPNQVMALGTPLETGQMGGGALEAISQRFPRFAEALKVYHGSPRTDIQAFDPNQRAIPLKGSSSVLGTFFTHDPQYARFYAKGTGKVYPATINGKLYQLSGEEFQRLGSTADFKALRESLQSTGYDGVSIPHLNELAIWNPDAMRIGHE